MEEGIKGRMDDRIDGSMDKRFQRLTPHAAGPTGGSPLEQVALHSNGWLSTAKYGVDSPFYNGKISN